MDDETRKAMIAYVADSNCTIAEASHHFDINYSTAKYIINKHRQDMLAAA